MILISSRNEEPKSSVRIMVANNKNPKANIIRRTASLLKWMG